MATEHVDVLIVGAGLSGIGAAYHLQTLSPKKRYAILEARDTIGGTWDLFRYPGIRSDSDMYTLGYAFKPWREAKAIADGPSILRYVRETAAENAIDQHIRFNHKVTRASWDSAASAWTVEAERADGTVARFTCGFLFMCSGYYSYDEGHRPTWEGEGDFRGSIVHPQFWPEDLDYAGKRVVVIGSGATAVTLVPEMAKTAAHVTMLQRSPTYMASRPAEDALANKLREKLPPMLAYNLIRARNVLFGMYFFNMARKKPEAVKQRLLEMTRAALPEGYDVETHFTPKYNPWDQRLCLVPDNDLFEAIKAGSASVVTDQIERFTETGIRLQSGRELEADVVVTATGLQLQLLGGMEVFVDGEKTEFSKVFSYKGMMYTGVPNLASSFGYTNASWTLKCDLTCAYVCKLLNYMDANGFSEARPAHPVDAAEIPWLDFSSGYVQRSIHLFPKQADKGPWKQHQNYAKDLLALKFGKVNDEAMQFSRPRPVAAAPEAPERLAA
jgi:monooxygenase